MKAKKDNTSEISPADEEKIREEVMLEKELNMDGATAQGQEWVPPSPYNALEYNHSITVPSWGEPEHYSPDAQEKLHKSKDLIVDKENDVVIAPSKESLLQYLQIILKKDLRLGNLNELTGEITYCKEHLDFAYDCIDSDYPESSQLCIERAASMVELSHSKGGFFRKLIHTITKRDYKEIKEPNQKGIFGAPKEQTNDGGF
jgi:hypothetical protein